jgi:hypothetical protein
MTAPELFAPHCGGHCAPPSRLARFFRRVIAAVRRGVPVPAGIPAGTGTVLLAGAEPVMRDRMISEVRARWDAERMNPGHQLLTDAELAALRPRRVLPREDGQIVIDERNHVHVRPVNGRYLGTLPRRQPGASLPYVEPLVDRGPGHPPWMTGAFPVYGQAPVARVQEAERLAKRLIA